MPAEELFSLFEEEKQQFYKKCYTFDNDTASKQIVELIRGKPQEEK